MVKECTAFNRLATFRQPRALTLYPLYMHLIPPYPTTRKQSYRNLLMTANQQLTSRERVATALGLSPSAKELSILSSLLGGLSTVSVRGTSVTIPIPKHLVRTDVEHTLQSLPALTLSGDETTIIATRSDSPVAPAPLSLTELKLPPPTPRAPEVDRAEVPPERSSGTGQPKPLDPRVRQRATQLLEALEMPLGGVHSKLSMIAVLEKASGFIIRETKNTRSDGFILISVENQDDASALLVGLGFTRTSAKHGNVWAGLSYQRVCHQSDTKASASIAHTARGCDVTIEYGEPLTDSRTVTREYSAMSSTGSVD
jgi:hypothetical protein